MTMHETNKEKKVLQEVFETKIPQRFSQTEKLPTIDAFAQFSQNPTSMSAGYGIEENYSLIGENLKKRYGLGRIGTDNILAFLKESFGQMKQINYEVYFWRDTIADYIKSKYTENFLQWFDSLCDHLDEKEKKRFLFLLYALDHTKSGIELHRWFSSFFDKEEILPQQNTENSLVRWGLGNFLHYRTTSGYVERQFKVSYLLDNLRKRFKEKMPIQERQTEDFFKGLLLDNIKLLEKCSKQTPPVFYNTLGRITQTAPLIAESSKSYFGISPFALDKIKELIKAEKENLTEKWKEKFSEVLNSFVKQNYPYTELKSILDVEGAHCWEIRYVETPEKTPISITIVLSPYLFSVTQSFTILDEVRRTSSSPLNMIFLIKETLPTIADIFKYAAKRNLIFLFDEGSQSFYLMERSAKLPEDVSLSVDAFLSNFLPFLEKEIQISKVLPAYLKDYIENLKYFNRYPRLVSIRNSMLKVEPKLRESVREKLSKKYGDQWKEKVTEIFSKSISKWENRIQQRLDREKARDFLDGTTLGELINVAEAFHDVFGLDKNLVKGFLNILNQHRKVLVHLFTEPVEDLDEKTFKSIMSALEYIETVICSV